MTATCSICDAPSAKVVAGKGLCVQHAQDYEYFHKYEYNLEDGDFQEVFADWIEDKREDLFG